IRHDQRQPVEYQLPEARVILRQIIDLRLIALDWRALRLGLAVEGAWAIDFEIAFDGVVARIEVALWAPLALRVALDAAQRVGRKITGAVHDHLQRVVQLRVVEEFRLRADDVYVADAPPAFDQHVLLAQSLRRFAQEARGQRALIIADAQIIQSVKPR